MMNLKRAMVIGMVTVGAVSLIGCAAKDDVTKEETAQEMTTEVVTEDKNEEIATSQIANPFVDVDSLEEAATKAGFKIVAPESVEGYDGTQIQVIENDLIQVIYGDLEHNVYVRKSTSEGDVSGDYNDYEAVEEKEINGHNVTIKSNGNFTYVVTWTDGTYSYSIQSNGGFDFAVAEKLLEVVK